MQFLSPFAENSDRWTSLMIVDAQYAPSLFHVLPLRSSPHVSPFFRGLPASFTRSTRHYRTGCCTLPFAAAGNIVLSHAPPLSLLLLSPDVSLIQRADEGSIDLRDSIVETYIRRARRLDRADYLKAGAHVSSAFADCGQAKEHGKVIKSATRCVIVEELISEIAQVYMHRTKVDLDREDG